MPNSTRLRASVKWCFALLFTLSLCTGGRAQNVSIDEFHYDNSGTDADELIEIAASAGSGNTGQTPNSPRSPTIQYHF